MTPERYGYEYERGFQRTVRFLLSRGVPSDSARESAQVAWVRGWERLGQLRDDSTVLTWVNTIALNVYRSLVRKGAWYEPLTEVRTTSSIDLAAMDLARILAACRPSDRVLLEQYVQGISTKEIAHAEGVSETAIRIRLLRARRSAREIAENRSYVCRRKQAFGTGILQAA